MLWSVVALFLFSTACFASEDWTNNELTTLIWRYVSSGDLIGLKRLYRANPNFISARSEDGRGALFWAYEYQQPRVIALLEKSGASTTATGADGRTPKELAPSGFVYKPTPEDLAETWELPPEEEEEEEEDPTAAGGQNSPSQFPVSGEDPLAGIDDDL